MSEQHVYPVPADFAAQANVTAEQYQSMYKQSVDDPSGFWAEQADNYLTFMKKWDTVLDWSFDENDLHINWFKGATLNVSSNCLDRHLETRGDQVAIIWEGDDPNEDRKITYRELHEEVNKFANVLKSRGVKKGDRVSLYLPMIPEAAVAMLARLYAQEMPDTHICALAPGLIHTRMQDYLCQQVDSSRYPSIQHLIAARDTDAMPAIDEAATRIAGAFKRCLDHPSGSFLDIRQL